MQLDSETSGCAKVRKCKSKRAKISHPEWVKRNMGIITDTEGL